MRPEMDKTLESIREKAAKSKLSKDHIDYLFKKIDEANQKNQIIQHKLQETGADMINIVQKFYDAGLYAKTKEQNDEISIKRKKELEAIAQAAEMMILNFNKVTHYRLRDALYKGGFLRHNIAISLDDYFYGGRQ